MRTVKYMMASELLDGDRLRLSPEQCAGQRLDPRSSETDLTVLGRHDVEHPGPGGTGTETSVRFFGVYDLSSKGKNSHVITLEPTDEVVAVSTVARAEKKGKR